VVRQKKRKKKTVASRIQKKKGNRLSSKKKPRCVDCADIFRCCYNLSGWVVKKNGCGEGGLVVLFFAVRCSDVVQKCHERGMVSVSGVG
jgi:hypothetical protein